MWLNDKYWHDIFKLKKRVSEDSRVKWVTTGEEIGDNERFCMVGKTMNDAFRRNLVTGEYFCTFYDDDIYHKDFFAIMTETLDAYPEYPAAMCNQLRSEIYMDGSKTFTGSLIPASNISGRNFDCRIDGGQVVFRTSVLELIEQPYMFENKGAECSHSDGIFLDRIGEAVYPQEFLWIDQTLMENRKFPFSTYSPTGEYISNKFDFRPMKEFK